MNQTISIWKEIWNPRYRKMKYSCMALCSKDDINYISVYRRKQEDKIMVINPIVYDEKGKGNDVFSGNLVSRVIHLVGEVTDEMTASVVAQLGQE